MANSRLASRTRLQGNSGVVVVCLGRCVRDACAKLARRDMFISGPNGGLRSEKGLILQIHVCPGFRSRQPSRVVPM